MTFDQPLLDELLNDFKEVSIDDIKRLNTFIGDNKVYENEIQFNGFKKQVKEHFFYILYCVTICNFPNYYWIFRVNNIFTFIHNISYDSWFQ